jgi:hypothetical protein
MHTGYWWRKLKGKGSWEDLGIGGMIILKSSFSNRMAQGGLD